MIATFFILQLTAKASFYLSQNSFAQFPLVDQSLCPAKIGQLLPEVKYPCPILQLDQIFHAVKFLLSCHFVIGTSKSCQHASRASQGLGHGRIGLEKTSVPQWGGTLWRQGYLGVQVGEWATWEWSGLGYIQYCQSQDQLNTHWPANESLLGISALVFRSSKWWKATVIKEVLLETWTGMVW